MLRSRFDASGLFPGEAVENSAQLETRESSKRRSSRIVQAVPLSVTAVDALGRPFVERTSTIVVNCHGCRYQSKHYVLKNMWVTLEVPHSGADHSPRQVRGRVTWVQRPHGVRERFEVGVELEIPGNLWGIAFSPPDWIPFPDTPFSDTNRQEAEVSPREPAESTSHEHTAEREKAGAASRDNVRMVTPGSEGELSAALARQMEPLVDEAKQHLHETIRGSATPTLSAEARPLVAALYAQFQEAERRATPGSGEGLVLHNLGQAGIAEQDSLKKIRDEVGEELESRLRALREQWNLEISEIARQTSERAAAELGQLEQERRGEFEQRVESKLRQTIDDLEWAAGEARSKVAHAQENLAELRKYAEEAAAPLRAIEESLCAQAEISRVQLAGIETAAREFEQRIASALDNAQSDWQMRLETSMGSAAALWNERIQALIESEVNRAAQEMTRRSGAAAEESEKAARSRLAGLGSEFEEITSQAESRFGALQFALEEGVRHAQETLTQISSMAAGMEEQGSRLRALALSTRGTFERGLSDLMETSGHELERRASESIATWAERLQPILETAGQQTVTRLGGDLERELGAHLDRAGEVLGNLQSGIRDAEATLHAHEDRVIKVSERTAETVIERLEKVANDLESNFEQSAKVVAARWLDEIDLKATEATHTTFEASFKTAEWYEKKVQAQMQAEAEKSLARCAESLREKASETFRLFGTELDHYSRSYVEHTQSQFADGARENLDVISRQAGEIAATASASLSEEAQKHIGAGLAELRSQSERRSF